MTNLPLASSEAPAAPSMAPAGRPCPATTILILGSKPDPALPPADAYAAIACANASGFSAKAHGLRAPLFTVVSAVLGSGNASDRHSLAAMRGLVAGRVYFLPRPLPHGSWRRLRFRVRHWRLQAPWVRHLLRRHGLEFAEFVERPTEAYDGLLLRVAGDGPELLELVRLKRPSTGLVALALGLGELGFAQAILTGFDFTLRHAYGHNPLIDQRGSANSKHADTDMALLAAIQQRRHCLWTSEPAVAERTCIPLLRLVDG